MLWIAALWRRSILFSGATIGRLKTIELFLLGDVAKYLPAAPWGLVGRAELARRAGVVRSAAYWSVVLSQAALTLSAAAIAVVSFPLARHAPVLALWGLSVLPIGLCVLHPRVMRMVVGVVERISRGRIDVPAPSWRSTVSLLALYIPAWLSVGGAAWCVARSLKVEVGYWDVLFASSLSWLAGLVVPFAPAGIGVREATFVAVASFLPAGQAAAVAVWSRVIFMTVDGAAASTLLLGRLLRR